MGVDARMEVRLKEPATEQQIKDWSWHLAGAFYREPFWFDDNGLVLEYDSINLIIKVFLSCRYYCPNYERGPLPTIILIAEFLEYHTKGEIYYGGDSEDELSLFNQTVRDCFKQHFFNNGHWPYVNFSLDPQAVTLCPTCEKPMFSCGGGGSYSFELCYGCGTPAITRNRIILKTWSRDEHKETSFFEKSKELYK